MTAPLLQVVVYPLGGDKFPCPKGCGGEIKKTWMYTPKKDNFKRKVIFSARVFKCDICKAIFLCSQELEALRQTLRDPLVSCTEYFWLN